MPDLKSIPDDTKWQLAARCAARMPVLYDAVFRPVAGKEYDELEQAIWIELSRFSLEIARTLQLPVRNAREVAQSLLLVKTILFGPEFKGETIEVGEDGAVVIIKRCPFLTEGGSAGATPDAAFRRCMAFTLSSQNHFNPKYNSRFIRAMCMGDRQCEFKVEPEKVPEEKGKR